MGGAAGGARPPHKGRRGRAGQPYEDGEGQPRDDHHPGDPDREPEGRQLRVPTTRGGGGRRGVVDTVLPWVTGQSGQHAAFSGAYSKLSCSMSTRGSYCSFAGVLDRLATHKVSF